MRRGLRAVGALLALAILYFLLWPVPVEPVAWTAPVNKGYVDPFAPNDLLRPATGIDLGKYVSPEDAVLGTDGRVYVSTKNGSILAIRNRAVKEFADVGGKPLGIEQAPDGSLVVANAVSGLQRIHADGRVETLLDAIDGEPLANANNLDITPDGTIYFSRSGTRFTAAVYGDTMDASLLDILEHGNTGAVFAFDPESGETRTVVGGLSYANGVAVSDDGSFLLVAETASYRILKHWLSGENAGTTEVLIDNLPGFPDNIRNGLNGRFWVGFAAPRNDLVDKLSDKPFIRKMIQRLPAALRPNAVPFSHVVAINGNGEVLMNLHDPDARFPRLTGVLETRSSLYLTTLLGNQLPRLNKRDLGD